MTPYHLAKLVIWAGRLHTRKRLQKTVYLLQSAGCRSMDAHFILHHYGPYSAELASLCDRMVARGLLNEHAEPNVAGLQYSYELSPDAKRLFWQLESAPQNRGMVAQIEPFEPLARALLHADLADLECGSTIVFFRRHEYDWAQAVEKACEFKRLPPDSMAVDSATQLARRVTEPLSADV